MCMGPEDSCCCRDLLLAHGNKPCALWSFSHAAQGWPSTFPFWGKSQPAPGSVDSSPCRLGLVRNCLTSKAGPRQLWAVWRVLGAASGGQELFWSGSGPSHLWAAWRMLCATWVCPETVPFWRVLHRAQSWPQTETVPDQSLAVCGSRELLYPGTAQFPAPMGRQELSNTGIGGGGGAES